MSELVVVSRFTCASTGEGNKTKKEPQQNNKQKEAENLYIFSHFLFDGVFNVSESEHQKKVIYICQGHPEDTHSQSVYLGTWLRQGESLRSKK